MERGKFIDRLKNHGCVLPAVIILSVVLCGTPIVVPIMSPVSGGISINFDLGGVNGPEATFYAVGSCKRNPSGGEVQSLKTITRINAQDVESRQFIPAVTIPICRPGINIQR